MTSFQTLRPYRVIITFGLAVLLALLAFSSVPTVRASTSGVVISAFYTRGGSVDATYINKYIELFNAGSSAVNINGWTLRYASSSATTWPTAGAGINTMPNITLQPGQYFLVQGGSNGENGAALPTPDLIGSINSSGTAGKIALFTNGDACAVADASTCANYVDFVGYGTANASEGSSLTVSHGLTEMTARKNAGCIDTDVNGNDFEVLAVNPRNTSTTLAPCPPPVDNPPSVSGTTPANSAGGVLIDSNITVNFNEPVTVSAASFTLECPVSTPITFDVSGIGSSAITLNPISNLPFNTTCAVNVIAANVTDLDGTADPMTADYTFTFTTAAPLVCGDAPDKIYELQDNGAKFGVGGTRTVDGVVIFDGQAGGQWDGFYIQDPNGDGNSATSDGIYVYDPSPALRELNVGDYVRVTGTVSEFAQNFSTFTPGVTSATETQLTATSVLGCDNTATVTPTLITLPFATLDQQEQYEGMLVTINQTLTVTELFTLGRYNEISLSVGRLFQPTNYLAPGAAALAQQEINNRSRILLDDGRKLQNPSSIVYPAPELTASNTVRHGDTVASVTGLFTQANSRFGNGTSSNTNPFRYRLNPTAPVTFTSVNVRPTNPPVVGGDLKVVSLNLLNYFNTVPSTGACYEDGLFTAGNCRGANNPTEFTRQRDKTIAAIVKMNPSVLGVNELENDAVDDNGGLNGPVIAMADLVNGLNAATAPGTYAYIDTGRLGTDAIRVGFIYQPALVTPVGGFATLDNVAPFNVNTRPPLAQLFEEVATGERFIAIVNHFKSKGCGGAAGLNLDQGDGQSCYNADRVLAATEMVNWINTNPYFTDPDVLVMGDLNSYAAEDPITYLQSQGYINLIDRYVGPGNVAYSYVFDGQSGYLDHMLASRSLNSQTTSAADYHINADEAPILDYNTEFKSAGQITSLYAADEFRISDHDPVILGLDLRAADVIVTVSDGTTVVSEAGATDTYSVVLNKAPSGSLTVQLAFNDQIVLSTDGVNYVGSPIALSFSPLNWDIPQTVTVRAIDDAAIEGNHTSTITLSFSGDATEFTSLLPELVDVSITDNDSPVVNNELLLNPSFEDAGTAPRNALHWTGTLLAPKFDRRTCSVTAPGFAADGNCVFRFKYFGSVPNPVLRSLRQVIQSPAVGLNDTLNFSVQYRASNLVNNARIRVRVFYANQPTQNVNIVIPAGTYGYTTATRNIVLTGTPTRIVVLIQPQRTFGTFFVDDLSLAVNPAVSPVGGEIAPLELPLPLPPAPEVTTSPETNGE